MERALGINTKITLNSNTSTTEFIIESVLGCGASSVAYVVSFQEDEEIVHRGVLKEYCPVYLKFDDHFQRNGECLIIPEEYRAEFQAGVRNFKDVYKRINQYLNRSMHATNYHPHQLGLYEGNGTVYTLVTCDDGISYDRISSENIESVLEVMIAVTTAVGHYHDAGLLHLDIKSKNIMILNGGVFDLIKLFDYDSITEIEKLKPGNSVWIPIPEDYYVPELVNTNVRKIGKHTDVFEIGAMLFSRLYGRAPQVSEMQRRFEFDFADVSLLKGVSPAFLYELQVLFKHTLQTSPTLRYQDTVELKAQLEKLLALARRGRAYLLNMPKWQPSARRIGRDKELEEISERLDRDGYVFVQSMGGVGKSEIAKLFAAKYAKQFHTVQFCKYTGSLKVLTAALHATGYDKKEELEKGPVDFKNEILHMSDEGTLIVVDNFNVSHDDFLKEFLPANNKQFKVIFTTRCKMASDYYEDKMYYLSPLSEKECVELFCKHCHIECTAESRLHIERIVQEVQHNTLVVILLAKTMERTGMGSEEMLEKLQAQDLNTIGAKIFHEYDMDVTDGSAYNALYTHLQTVFNISGLAPEEIEVLINMTLISPKGIKIEEMLPYCRIAGSNANAVIRDLIDSGWLENIQGDVVSMHPAISDVLAADQRIPKAKGYHQLEKYLEQYVEPEYHTHIDILESKLAAGLQLNRRYKEKPARKRVVLKAQIAGLYINLLQQKEARAFLAESEILAKTHHLSWQLPLIYYYQSVLESKVGTKKATIESYQKTIKAARQAWFYPYKTRILVEATADMGFCYLGESEYEEAYKQYEQALQYAKRYKLWFYADNILENLIEICQQLGWNEKESKYRAMQTYLAPFAEKKSEEQEKEDLLTRKINEGEVEFGCGGYETMLVERREAFGEDSPAYRDLAQHEWIFQILQGEKEVAKHKVAENLEYMEKTLGKDSMPFARELANVGLLLSEIWELEYATECASRAISICEAHGESDSYLCVCAKMALMKVYCVQGQLEVSKEILDSIDFSKYQSKSQLGDILKHIGLLMLDMDKRDEVKRIAQTLLTRKNLPVYDGFWGNTILGQIHIEQGDVTEAKQYEKEAKTHLDRIEEYPKKRDLFLSYYRLSAAIAYEEGNYSCAVRELETLIEMYDEQERKSLYLLYVVAEHGLYCVADGQLERAEEDCRICENVMEKENLSKEGLYRLYQELSLAFVVEQDAVKTQKYIEKLREIDPELLETPECYADALMYNNLGWAKSSLGELQEAEELYRTCLSAIPSLEEDYGLHMIAANNLFLLFLQNDRAGDAYDFAVTEQERFKTLYGENSEKRLEFLLELAAGYMREGYNDCEECLEEAKDILQQKEFDKTIHAAKWHYLYGLCKYYILDEKEEGVEYLNYSKELYESLDKTTDIYYQDLLEDINYLQTKQ